MRWIAATDTKQSFLSTIIAGYMAADGNWRLCFWAIVAFEAPLLVYFCLLFEESKYIPRIIGRAAMASPQSASVTVNKKETGSTSENADQETSNALQVTATHTINPDIPLLTWRQRMRLITRTEQSLFSIIKQSLIVLFKFPAVMYTGLTYAFCLCWISAQASIVSIVFTQPPYNFGTVGVGNMSLGVFIGCILGSAYGALTDRCLTWFARRNYGYYEPEMRLKLNHLPAVCMGGGFIMFGVTAAKVGSALLCSHQTFHRHEGANTGRGCIGSTQASAAPSLALGWAVSATWHSASSLTATRRWVTRTQRAGRRPF